MKWDHVLKIEVGEHCVWCGCSVAVGSGRFIGRIESWVVYRDPNGEAFPSVTWLTPEEISRLPINEKIIIEGWMCARCAAEDCGICGEPMNLDDDWPHPQGFRTCAACASPGNVREAMERAGYEAEEVEESISQLIEARASVGSNDDRVRQKKILKIVPSVPSP